MRIQIKPFQELSGIEVYELLRLRSEVFVVEQQCVYLDMDGLDTQAFHVMGMIDNRLMAYTRIFPPGVVNESSSIGRVVVHPDGRTKGYGKEILAASIEFIENRFHTSQIVLSAQSYLQPFYRAFGFLERGTGYLEDGIPHIKMVRN